MNGHKFGSGVLALSLLLIAGLVGGGTTSSAATLENVVVQAGSPGQARIAVEAVGGRVQVELPIIDGVAARVPGWSLLRLRETPGVRAVTPNEHVRVSETAGSRLNSADEPRSVYAQETNAQKLWQEGVIGTGVRVALVDTGISALPDLEGRVARVPDPIDPHRTADCVNFSGESTCSDSYGHGTFMAGLIAGSGASSAYKYIGMAPGAQLVSIKIAGRDGSADVSKVLAAIQWAVSFSKPLGIRVLNLSLGTNSRVTYHLDPLNLAVQRAWRSGLIVVVAASNRGPVAGTISKPGDDPLVLTVGAVNDRQTPAVSDDTLPNFSGRGPTAADGLSKPDIAAPGGRIIGLRSPGSFIEEKAPGGGVSSTYRRGSGTSMAAAITSGAAALLVAADPAITPDRAKFALTGTAQRGASTDPMAVGAGVINAYAAARSAGPGLANQSQYTLSDGTGSLDGSRAQVLVTRTCRPFEELIDPHCDHVHGDRTAQDRMWDGAAYTDSDWTAGTWYDSQWAMGMGSSWYGSSWYGSSWYGSSWYGSSWYGTTGEGGSGDDVFGIAIPGSSWYGAWE